MLQYYPMAQKRYISDCSETVHVIMKSRMQESRIYGSVRGLYREM